MCKSRNFSPLTAVPVGLRNSQTRQISTSRFSSSMYLDITQKDNVAQLLMKRDPVNSWSLEFLEELCIAFEDLENDRDCHGIIIGSVSHWHTKFEWGEGWGEQFIPKSDSQWLCPPQSVNSTFIIVI